MLLNKTHCYAIMILRYLGELQATESSPVRIQDCAAHYKVRLAYLAKVGQTLSARGLTQTTRGPNGGSWLAKPLHEVSVGEIIRMFQDPNRAKPPATLEAFAAETEKTVTAALDAVKLGKAPA